MTTILISNSQVLLADLLVTNSDTDVNKVYIIKNRYTDKLGEVTLKEYLAILKLHRKHISAKILNEIYDDQNDD